MLKQLISFIKIMWANIWPMAEPCRSVKSTKKAFKKWRKEDKLHSPETAKEYCDRISGNIDPIPGYNNPLRDNIDTIRRENLLKIIIKSLNDEGYYDFDIYWEQGLYYIAIPNRVIGNIYACGTWQQFFIMYKLVMLKWGYKRSELEFIEPCSEQSVILPKMDEIVNWIPDNIGGIVNASPDKVKQHYNHEINVCRKFLFNGDIPHPYPSEQDQQEEIRKALCDLFDFGEVTLEKLYDNEGNLIGIKVINDKVILP